VDIYLGKDLKHLQKKKKYDEITQKKISTTVEQLCKGFPQEFALYLNYCRSLHFEDKPNYSYLRKLFKDLFEKEGYKADAMYDWVLLKCKEKENKNLDNSFSYDSSNKLENLNEEKTSSTIKSTIGSKIRNSPKDNNDNEKKSSFSKLIERKSSIQLFPSKFIDT
jgi:hypothetical protein